MTDIMEHLKDFQTLYAALIGALGLYLIFLQTSKRTFDYHKSDKLAETRLKAYMELTGKYTDYLVYLSFNVNNISEDVKENLTVKLNDIIISYNQVCLVSSSSIRDKLDIFLNDQLVEMHHMILNDRVDIRKVFKLEEDGISLSVLLRQELGVLNDPSIDGKILNRATERNSKVALVFNEKD